MIPLFDGVRVPGTWADMLLGADGTLLYVEGEGVPWADRLRPYGWKETARPERLTPHGGPREPRTFSSLALSPNEDRLAISIRAFEGTYDLWVKQLPMGPLSRLTFEGTINQRATLVAER